MPDRPDATGFDKRGPLGVTDKRARSLSRRDASPLIRHPRESPVWETKKLTEVDDRVYSRARARARVRERATV